jgi:hypothetical protein
MRKNRNEWAEWIFRLTFNRLLLTLMLKYSFFQSATSVQAEGIRTEVKERATWSWAFKLSNCCQKVGNPGRTSQTKKLGLKRRLGNGQKSEGKRIK